MPVWLLASVTWALMVGVLGVTTKIALRYTDWPIVVAAAAGFYVLLVVVFAGRGMLELGRPGWWLWAVLISGLLSATSLPVLNYALQNGSASQVVPITATYPVITALLAAAFLKEALTVTRGVGIALVIGGAVLVAR